MCYTMVEYHLYQYAANLCLIALHILAVDCPEPPSWSITKLSMSSYTEGYGFYLTVSKCLLVTSSTATWHGELATQSKWLGAVFLFGHLKWLATWSH